VGARLGARLVRERPAAPPDATLVCTGAWTPGITPLWGAVAEVTERHSGHALEELEAEPFAGPGSGGTRLFSAIGTAIGSSVDAHEPEPQAMAPELLRRAARFVPALRDAEVRSARACPRPVSPDGRPLIGAVAERVHVCAGHGPWGISLGPGSAEVAVGALLHSAPVPRAYDVTRIGEAGCARIAARWA
jgi:D-amino-acid dehydrogenase